MLHVLVYNETKMNLYNYNNYNTGCPFSPREDAAVCWMGGLVEHTPTVNVNAKE